MLLTLSLLALMQDSPKTEDIIRSGELIGLEFEESEAELMRNGVKENLESYAALRGQPLDNALYPAIQFSPLLPGMELRTSKFESAPFSLAEGTSLERPDDLEDLAFETIPNLARLIRSRTISCVELTTMYLARLKRLDEKLHCVITLTEERALRQAAELDSELEAGNWRGPLHGIPWGAKDLLATRGTRTTWGAKPFEEQMLDYDATVVERLDEAGAVLIAKLSLGALAWGDVWFGERTRNPWNPDTGSSGSSAGPASATAAGCVVFAIGSETLGSIISPSETCGNSSLRPTFGRVSRHGAMALSWSMDKLGPMCRSIEDCGIVLAAIHGSDQRDPSVIDKPLEIVKAKSLEGLRIGYTGRFAKRERDAHVLETLRGLKCELVEIELPDLPLNAMSPILSAEAAAAFDALTRDGRDAELVRQVERAWPNVFRTARLVPAVEYINANRLRVQAMREMHEALAGVDLYVHSAWGGPTLQLTNLTGHPTAICPSGFRDDGTPYGICFTGQLFDEATLIAVAQAWQEAGTFHERHPEL